MNHRRVAFVTPDLFLGGAQQHIALLCKNLDRRTYEPVVICLYSGGAFEKILKESRVRVVRLAGGWVYWLGRKISRKFNNTDLSPDSGKSQGWLRTFAFGVAEWLSALELPFVLLLLRVDLVSTHLLTVAPAVIASKIASIPVVYTEHSVIDTYAYNRGQTKLLRNWLPKVDRIIAVSEATRRSLIRELGLPQEKIQVIGHSPSFLYPPAPTDLLLESKPMLVAILSRLVKYKGHDSFIAAAKILSSRFTDVRFLIAGYGELRPQLEKQVEMLGLKEIIEFSGEYRNDDLPELLKNVAIVAVPSLSEALGIVALEAMACGIPVVASRTGGLQELVQDGQNGYLVPPDDPPALADALALLLEDPVLRARMAKSAFEWACQFTPAAIASQTSAVYDQMGQD